MNKIGLLFSLSLLTVAALHGQSPNTSAARLVIRSGIVEVQRGSLWFPIATGDALNPGDRVRTAAGSVGAIEIARSVVVTLNEHSQVQINPLNGSAAVQLESGSMKLYADSEIQVAAKDTLLESADRPLDLELGYQANRVNLTVFNGSVRSGSITIRGGSQDSSVRTYRANGMSPRRNDPQVSPDQTFYVYPYFLYGNPDPNAGRIVPPVVNNTTNPGYRPTQIVPPMSDPIRVPVTK
jgi:ferric-dicitrate binding protein FerR (iron transport regulator)